MSDDTLRVRLRPRRQDDDRLIYSSWLRHLSKSSGLLLEDVEKGARALIDAILRSSTTRVMVAEDAGGRLFDGAPKVLGYCVSDPEMHALHFVYVKRESQGWGVCKTLVRDVAAYNVPPLQVLRVWHIPRNVRFVRRCVPLVYDPSVLAGMKR